MAQAKSPEEEHPVKAFGWAAVDSSGILSPFNFSRRETGEHDVKVKILFCGICHSDLHQARNERGITKYPIVPGHEITGLVAEVGSKVTKFKVGDKIGVGVMVGSCTSCERCNSNEEQQCSKGFVPTYNGTYLDGTRTYGGYSDTIVVNERFTIRWPESLPLDSGAPLLCAGITTYSPLRHFGLDKPGMHIGVVGLGGLGHVGVKIAKAFGAKVTVISTSAAKRDEAITNLGADSFLLSNDQDQLQAAAQTMDGIIDTVSATHPILPLISLLKYDGKLVLLGAVKSLELPAAALLIGKISENLCLKLQEIKELPL
ncbi:OLC1v1011632C1 [Oldenlandia corymbosa var. corymbosa]|uniref:OLC1v1011632C1 n=1 Tax=Oldenlandia corymbosa var. corymbosa TaxID=529605 RepID=A0AAV1DU37_OLDCO|nr:OLC1v1011632C1 [Oldenlandia corymbosa var. corymbosa]